MNETLKVAEIFYSIQGEGFNQGMPAIFIRLAGCNMACSFCDTKWDDAKDWTIQEILSEIARYNCDRIIWTGGEPTLQLTDDVMTHFAKYINYIETNGTNRVPRHMNYVSCSPKNDAPILARMGASSEYRFAIRAGDPIPNIDRMPYAANYFLSPIFEGPDADQLSPENVNYCVQIIKGDPRWKLSIQVHKLLSIQ
jgi:organic radical activating enzyme